MHRRFISIVIPSLNRPDAVVDVVEDFLRQDYPTFEIIVVDQQEGEHARLASIARRDPRLRVLRTEVVGTCHARNLGVKAARGEIILFSDDDNRIKRGDFLGTHGSAYDDPSIGGVGGRVIDKNIKLNREQTGPVCTVSKTGRVFPNATATVRQEITAPRGGNMSFRRSIIEHLGGFDERFRGNAMREETDFSLRVVAAGWKIIFEPSAENVHLGLPAGTRSVDRLTWYEQFFFNEALFFRKHFPVRYLPFLIARKLRPIFACIVYYGRFRPRAFRAPLRGFIEGWRAGSAAVSGSYLTAKPLSIWFLGFAGALVSGAIAGVFGLPALLMIIAIAIGSVAVVATFRNPFIGVALVAFFLPFERIGSVEIAGFTLRISQALAAVTLISVLLRRARHDGKPPARNASVSRERRPPFPILLPLLAFIVANLLSFMAAVNLPRAVTVLGFTIFTAAVSFLVVRLVRTDADFRRIILVLLISATIVSAFGLMQFIGDLIGLPTTVTGLRDLYTKEVFSFPRVHATALEPLYYGNFLLLPIAFALTFLFARDARFRWPFMFPLLGLFLANLVFTLSRGAYLAATVLVLVVAGLFIRRVLSPFRLLALLLVGIGVYVIVLQAFGFTGDADYSLGRFVTQALDVTSGASYGDRAETFSEAWRAFREHPFVGIGSGNFGPRVADAPLVTPERGWLIVNNEYLEVLAETGILGFLSFLAVLAVLTVRSIRAFVRSRGSATRPILIASFAAFVAIFSQYLTFSTLYIMHVWFAIGLLIAAQNLILKPKV